MSDEALADEALPERHRYERAGEEGHPSRRAVSPRCPPPATREEVKVHLVDSVPVIASWCAP